MFPEKLTIELKPIDFKDTKYSDNCNCALSKAFKRIEGLPEYDRVSEAVCSINVADDSGILADYSHEEYLFLDFEDDQEKAEALGWDSDQVIRTIECKLLYTPG